MSKSYFKNFMVKLSNLEKFLDEYLYFDKNLKIEKIDPVMANGLMVRGREDVNKVGFGVSASLDLLKKQEKKTVMLLLCIILLIFLHKTDMILYSKTV